MTPPDPVDLPRLRTWLGRTEQRADLVTAAPLAAFAALVDRDDPAPMPGDAVPPLALWLFFASRLRPSELGPDGHPKRGGFLPPVPLPRRMWAGGRLEFHRPLRVGDEITRTSRIVSVDGKTGRSGALVFVTVRHEITHAGGLAISEEHDIVYRDAPPPPPRPGGVAAPPPQPAPTDEGFSRVLVPDPVLLFRYSALTFNSHRIHYDRSYATGVEGYPGLVVHGPLIATLLVDLLHREQPQAQLHRFAFTAVRPLFDTHPFTLCGRPEGDAPHGPIALWARDHEGQLAMHARAELD